MAGPRLFKDDKSTPLPICKIEKCDDGIFTVYASALSRDIARKKLIKEHEERQSYSAYSETSMADLLDCCPIKCHISLKKDDLAKVQSELIQLLLQAIAEGIINEFKQVKLDEVEKELKENNDDIASCHVFEQYLVDDEVVVPDDDQKLVDRWHAFTLKHDIKRNQYDFLSVTIKRLEQERIQLSRFIEGGQFIIYLQMKPNYAAISNLQNNLFKALNDAKVSPGNVTAAQSLVDKFFSIRLEELDGEYVSASIADEKIIARLQAEQTNAEIYKYLVKNKNNQATSFNKFEFVVKESTDVMENPFEEKLGHVNPKNKTI